MRDAFDGIAGAAGAAGGAGGGEDGGGDMGPVVLILSTTELSSALARALAS